MKQTNSLEMLVQLLVAAFTTSLAIAVKPAKPAKTQGTKGSKSPKKPQRPQRFNRPHPPKTQRRMGRLKTLAELTKGNFVKLSTAESKAKIFGYYNGTVVIDKKTGIKGCYPLGKPKPPKVLSKSTPSNHRS